MGRAQVAPSPVVPLGDAYDVTRFRCGDPSLNRWLKERARRNDDLWASRTFVIRVDDTVVGYYAISTGEISRSAVPGSLRRNMPDPIATMLLGRLAVDLSMQGRGLGASLLADALARMTGIGAIAGSRVGVVDAISEDARRFYARFGFMASVGDQMRLVIDLRNLRTTP